MASGWITEQYYHATLDFRRCASPFCGGYFLRKINPKKNQTRCGDGQWRDSCYVAAFDLSKLNMTEDDNNEFRFTVGNRGIVYGKYDPDAYIDLGFSDVSGFIVEAGWVKLEATVSKPLPSSFPSSSPTGPICDCNEDEACIYDPFYDCSGCLCPTICKSLKEIRCTSDVTCPTGMTCVDDGPVCDFPDCPGVCASIEPVPDVCGGLLADYCPTNNQTCFDSPVPGCDRALDCPGVCGQSIGALCGGSQNITCGPGLKCVDRLDDGCNESCDGTNCGGVCVSLHDTFFTNSDSQTSCNDCDAGTEVCIDVPDDGCDGCNCPTECRNIEPELCLDDMDCPDNLFCVDDGYCALSPLVNCDDVTMECTMSVNCAEGTSCSVKPGDICGGYTGLQCAPGLTCVDPLGDQCDVTCGGNVHQCFGVCVRDI